MGQSRIAHIIIMSLWAVGASAQIEISALDSALWRVDTLSLEAQVFPKFEFSSDTSIVFSDTAKYGFDRFLTVQYKKGSAYIVGDYTSDHGVESVYLYLNSSSGNLNSTTFHSLVDTVFSNDHGQHYCISMKSLGIEKPAVQAKLHAALNNQHLIMNDDFVVIATERTAMDPVTGCLGYFSIEEGFLPPYQVVFTFGHRELKD